MIISTLTIFSYPNSTDINNELIEYLFKNNDIKINNITLESKSLCQIENNIFGLILNGIKIIEVNKNSEYLSFPNGTEIAKDMLLTLSDILKLNINKNENIYNTFSYSIEYACQATEPNFEEYNNYKNKFITCEFGFNISDNNKICSEPPITTIIKTTVLDKIDTTIPKKIDTTIVNKLDTTIVDIFDTTNLNKIDTTIVNKIDTTNPHTTVPNIKRTIIQSSTQEIILDTEKICSIKDIILGNCIGELTDDMAQDIYLFIKNELINSNYTGENTIIKTPSITFQLTNIDYQKIDYNLNVSIIDLGECENKLKEKYNIPKEYALIIFKIDIQNINKSLTFVQYEVYNPETFKQLNLDVCNNILINITIPANLDSEISALYNSLTSYGYNLFNSSDIFYNDICAPYTTINNTDILLIDRKTDIYNKIANISICQDNCDFESYNDIKNMVSCLCNIQTNKTNMDLNIESNYKLKEISDAFYNYLNNSNFRVLKCYKVAFDLTTILENIGRLIMTNVLFIFILLFIIFVIKGNKQIALFIQLIINFKFPNNNMKNKNNQILHKKSKFKTNNTIEKRNNNKNNKKNTKNEKIKPNPIKKRKFKDKVIKNKKIMETNIIAKKTTKFPLKRNKNKKIITSNDNTLLKDNSLINRNNSNGIMINKKTGTKIKNNNNIFIYNVINNYNNKQKATKKQILKYNKISLNDQELNSLKYSDALIKDKRTYFQYYISLLKKKALNFICYRTYE